jgi:hypothetical protein
MTKVMPCGCKKKEPKVQVSEPVLDEFPETVEQFHAKEMDKYAQEIAEQTIKLFEETEEDE